LSHQAISWGSRKSSLPGFLGGQLPAARQLGFGRILRMK
jgi:hypothetical protein